MSEERWRCSKVACGVEALITDAVTRDERSSAVVDDTLVTGIKYEDAPSPVVT
jgi:hypothetical protein